MLFAAPAGTDLAFTTLEDTPYVFATADFGFIDSGDTPPNAFLAVKITTLPAAGSLINGTTLVAARQAVPVADIVAGKLQFMPAPNATGPSHAEFSFQVQDDGGAAAGSQDLDPTPNVLTIHVTPVNDPPSGTDRLVTTAKDTARIFSLNDFGFSDPDDSPSHQLWTVKIVTLPAQGTLSMSGHILDAGYSVSPAVYINRITFTPAPGQVGAVNFTFRVGDDAGIDNAGLLDPTPNTMTIVVQPASANQPPSGTDRTIPTLEDIAYPLTIGDFGLTDTADSPQHNLQAVKIATLPAPAKGSLTLFGTPVVAGQMVQAADILLRGLVFQPMPGASSPLYNAFAFQVQDDGSTAAGGQNLDQSPNTLTFDVLPVNDPPTGADRTLAVQPGSPRTFSPSDFGFADPGDDAPQSLLAVKLTTVPPHGMILIDNVPVTVGQSVAASEIAAGRVVFVPGSFAAGYTTFAFQLQDDGGTANGGIDLDPTFATITLAIGPTHPPSGADKRILALEDQTRTLAPAEFGFSDQADLPPHNFVAVRIVVLPSAGTLRNDGVLVTAGQSIPVSDIAAGKLQFTSVANAHGLPYAKIAFQVQDDGSTAGGGMDLDPTPNTVTIDVASINDAPRGTDREQSTLEWGGINAHQHAYGFTDPNDAPQNKFKAVRIVSVPEHGPLTLHIFPNPSTTISAGQIIPFEQLGGIYYYPTRPYNGDDTIRFQVQDDGGTALGGVDFDPVVRTFTIHVLAVNGEPRGADKTINAAEGVAYPIVPADFGLSDPTDLPANNLLAVKINTLPSAGSLTIAGTAVAAGQVVSAIDIAAGKLQFVPPVTGTASPFHNFTFQVQDDGGTANGGIDTDATPNTLTFNAVRPLGPPEGLDATRMLSEDWPYFFAASDFSFGATTAQLLGVWISSLPAAGSLRKNSGGAAVSVGEFIPAASIPELRFLPALNSGGSAYASFTFQVQDNGGTADGRLDLDPTPNTINFDVITSNDPPAGTNLTVGVHEDASYTFSLNDFPFVDADNPPNGLLAIRINTLPTSGILLLGNVPLTFGQFISKATIDSGQLRYIPPVNADGGPLAIFTFQVQDNGGTANGGLDVDPAPNTISINIVSVNDAPVGTSKAVSTPEDVAYTFTHSDWGFSDPNDFPQNSFSAVRITTLPAAGALINGGGNVNVGDFIPLAAIFASQLKFVPAPNAHGTVYANFTFQVQDNGGTASGGMNLDQSPNTITISITPVNDRPSGTDGFLTIVDNTSYVFQPADFGFFDPLDVPANSFQAVRIQSLPAMGSLTFGNVPVAVGQSISATAIYSALLRFTPVPNTSGTFTSFSFFVQDDGGTASGGLDVSSNSNTLTIQVVSACSLGAPSFDRDSTIQILEDQSYIFTHLNFGPEDPFGVPPATTNGVRIVTIPVAGNLTNNGVAVAPGQVIAAIDLLQGNLRFLPPPDTFGNALASFVFQVQDDNGLPPLCDDGRGTITFNVQSVNDAPAGTDGTVTLLEDRAHTLSVADFGFTDPNDTLFAHGLDAVFITTLPTNGDLFLRDVRLTPPVPGPGVPVPFIGMAVVTSASIVGGELRFVPAANANGTLYSQFTFQVKDNGGTAGGGTDIDPTPNTITFNVTPVNDPPSFLPIIVPPVSDESGLISVATQTSAGPPDEAGQKVTQFFVAGVSIPGLFSILPQFDADGNLRFKPQPNAKGTAQITIGLKDDGGTANGGIDTDASRTITIEVFKARAMHNALKPLDVSGDGMIVADDALDVINLLNAFGPQLVTDDGRAEGPYYDCNGDGFVTAADALEVINYLNAFGPDVEAPGSEGEGSQPLSVGNALHGVPSDPVGPADLDDLATLLALDISQVSSRRKR